MTGKPLHRRPAWLCALALLLAAVGAALAPGATLAGVSYPAYASRPPTPRLLAHQARSSKPPRPRRAHSKPRKVALRGNAARALVAFQAMQKYYYILGSGLYEGEPFSSLWPFSEALDATVSMAGIPGLSTSMGREVNARLIGLRSYLDESNAGASEGTYTSTLAAFDATVAPPAGPGGPKFYDDNDWVGIALARLYRLTHSASALTYAEQIMAFEMAGWESEPELACPGGIPFSNSSENTERNTVTNAPTVELAVQLYRITGDVRDLQFAELAYEWVRRCLLSPSGLYADHISPRGEVDPTLWSYNQGTMIGAGTLLFAATHDGAYLQEARQTAHAALSHFTLERLRGENPFFPAVYLHNLLYLDSVTHDPPGAKLAQAYVNYAWAHLRLANGLFRGGEASSAELLAQAAIVQIYALLSSPADTYF